MCSDLFSVEDSLWVSSFSVDNHEIDSSIHIFVESGWPHTWDTSDEDFTSIEALVDKIELESIVRDVGDGGVHVTSERWTDKVGVKVDIVSDGVEVGAVVGSIGVAHFSLMLIDVDVD
jgi:hypothetical protein